MMKSDPFQIGYAIKEKVKEFTGAPMVSESGHVVQVGDGVARMDGLRNVMSGELLEFEGGISGIALNLEEDSISAVLLGSDAGIKEGQSVSRTGKVAQVPAGDALLGRVVNALGEPIDQRGPIQTTSFRLVERVAPGVIARHKVDVPLHTGIKAIDSMVPIGRGQRQLIIGDRQTGKTAIAIDTIINQKGKNVKCIYVSIGQKASTVAGIVKTLTNYGAMEYTVVVAAGASDPAPLQYIAPFSGCAMGEEWMEQGQDVLIIYDDLTKHAVAYRAMSLLLRRPPGREAYPGDIFYLHSRLLERAGRLSAEYGGGSMTALPIVETQSADMSAYIPTNIISITDGQIYLESEAFSAGIRPAINPGLSVSRVGGSAQTPAMKKIAGPIRIELAQYRELASFAQFSSDLGSDTKRRLRRGELIVETLKQPQYNPISQEKQVLILFAVTHPVMEDIKVEEVWEFERGLLEYFDNWNSDILNEIRDQKKISKELRERIIEQIEQFKINFRA